MSNDIKTITDANFAAVISQAEQPILIDFWAPWCGPCRQIAPLLEEIAKTYQEKLIVSKINVDENQKVPAEFKVRGIPTLVLLDKEGNIKGTQVGATTLSGLKAFIDSHL